MKRLGTFSTVLIALILMPTASEAIPRRATFCQRSDGALLYRSSGTCPRGTREVNLVETLRGETGETGPAGPTGPTGPAPAAVASFTGRTDNSIMDGDFIAISGIQSPTNNEYDIDMVLPPVCKHVTKLNASTAGVPLSGTWTFTLRRDHASTALSCSMSDDTNVCSGTGSVENTSPGQTYFTVQVTATAGTPSQELAYVTIECD